MPKNRSSRAVERKGVQVGVSGLAKAVKKVLAAVGHAFKTVVMRKPSSSV